MIIHVLPNNTLPCGGIKVHYDLCEIEREIGMNSVIAFENTKIVPTWFSRHIGKILSFTEAKELAKVEKSKGKDVLVIGWENTDVLDIDFKDFICVSYIQGHVFWQGMHKYVDKYVWYVSNVVKNIVNFRGSVIEPFVRPEIFYPDLNKSFSEFPYKVLVQKRKEGEEAIERLKQQIINTYQFQFEVVNDVTEVEFAERLREAHIYFAHSYPEGFNLPALEAMASRTLVVGFTGGGGVEFMKNGENCFVAPDGEYKEVMKLFYKVKSLSTNEINSILTTAFETSKNYSKESTKNKLISCLKTIEGNF